MVRSVNYKEEVSGMKNRKKLMTLSLLLIFAGCMAGCTRQQENEQAKAEGKIEIVWQMELDLDSYEAYFNEVLEEKGYPYKVDFIMEAAKKKGQVVDLMEIGTTNWTKTYGVTEEILEGEVIALDEYFATEEGQELKATLPEVLWEAYQVDGQQYSILSTIGELYRTTYIWDETLAEEYDIQPEEWSEQIWEYEEELLKVKNGEAEKGKNTPVIDELTTTYLRNAIGMTKVLGYYFPIVIDENDEEIVAEFWYETEEYQETLKGMKKLYESGIYQPEIEGMGIIDSFLRIAPRFMTKEAYEQWETEEFWETHAVKVIAESTLWRFGCTAIETGITAESEKPEEVFRFMCALHTDPDLSNAIRWGKEGVRYEVQDGVVVKKGSNGEYLSYNRVGNSFIAHAKKGSDPEFRTVYPELIENARISKINGFNFQGKGCEKELEKVVQVSMDLDYVNGEVYLTQHDMIIEQYKKAGIDKVIEEWNREYQEWKSGQ